MSNDEDKDDLKELCFLLDEEREKMHQLAEQWKHFGTSTIHKLECQIVDYQDKLSELEQRQHSLVEENHSLKNLIEEIRSTQRKNVSTQTAEPTTLINDDPLQQQISIQNMFDAIKVKEKTTSIFLLHFDDFVLSFTDGRSLRID